MAASPADDPDLEVAEILISGEADEIAVGFDGKGEFAFWRQGEGKSVDIPKAEWELIRDGTLTHNHPPPSGSLQHIDFLNSIKHGLREIRAVGTDWIYILRRSGSEWPIRDEGLIMDRLLRAGEELHAEYDATGSGDDWHAFFWHGVWLKTAEDLKVEYEVRPMWRRSEPPAIPLPARRS